MTQRAESFNVQVQICQAAQFLCPCICLHSGQREGDSVWRCADPGDCATLQSGWRAAQLLHWWGRAGHQLSIGAFSGLCLIGSLSEERTMKLLKLAHTMNAIHRKFNLRLVLHGAHLIVWEAGLALRLGEPIHVQHCMNHSRVHIRCVPHCYAAFVCPAACL